MPSVVGIFIFIWRWSWASLVGLSFSGSHVSLRPEAIAPSVKDNDYISSKFKHHHFKDTTLRSACCRSCRKRGKVSRWAQARKQTQEGEQESMVVRVFTCLADKHTTTSWYFMSSWEIEPDVAVGQRGRQGLHQSQYQAREEGRRPTPAQCKNYIFDHNLLWSLLWSHAEKNHLFEVEGQHLHMTIFSIHQYLEYVCDLGNRKRSIIFTKGDADKTGMFGLKFLVTLCSKFLKNFTSCNFV